MLFESLEEAEFRLTEGVVLWNGLLFTPRAVGTYVDEILFFGMRVGADVCIPSAMFRGSEALQAAEGRPYLSREQDVLIAKVTDPGFNEFEPFPIGYIYHEGSPTYCQRMPTRKEYQGLTRQSLVFSRLRLSLSEEPDLRFAGSNFSFTMLRSVIEGENFCPVEKLPEAMKTSDELISVSHEVAILPFSSEAGVVFFEGLAVGSIPVDGPPDVVMKPDLLFLRSELMECGLGIKD